MHIDIDSFFVGVAIRNRPDLIDKPIAICHGKSGSLKPKDLGTDEHLYEKSRNHGKFKVEMGESFSEIASCSYSARAKGIRSNMYLGQAFKLCPDLICLDYDLPACAEGLVKSFNLNEPQNFQNIFRYMSNLKWWAT